MKIFHSCLRTDVVRRYKDLHPDKPIRALISYGRVHDDHQDLMLNDRYLINDLILDSGTFTLNDNPQKYRDTITLKGYMSYLDSFADKVDYYFNFDEDFSAEGYMRNFENQLYLEEKGYKPIPVIHDCYNNEIERYIDRGHQQIAIGSGELKHASHRELHRIVDGLYRKGVKVHFLGRTAYDRIANIPVYSADSTTWTWSGRSGRILYWNPFRFGKKKIDEIVLNDKPPKRLTKYHIQNYPFYRQFAEYLSSELGLTIDDLFDKKRFLNRALVNIHFYVLLEELVNRRHEELGFTFN